MFPTRGANELMTSAHGGFSMFVIDVERNQLVFSPRTDGKILNPLNLARVRIGVTAPNGQRSEMTLINNGSGELVLAPDIDTAPQSK